MVKHAQFVGNLPTNCLGVFDHFLGLALKGLTWTWNNFLGVVFGKSYHQINKFPLHKKMKFSIKDFFNKWDQIRKKLRIWSHLLKKSLIEKFIVRAVSSSKSTIETLEQPHKQMLKVNNTNITKKCEICSKLTIRTPERCQ